MSYRVRGLIEGFYGRLWTWDERQRVADRAAAHGFNTYVYAPKEDRLQNAGWRTPYPAETEERLAAFGERCAADGMDLWLGLRPVGISYADGADAQLVVDRLRRYLSLGATRLMLLADDIPAHLYANAGGRFASLADAHAWLIDFVVAGLPAEARDRLLFVPTDYHGAGSPYLEVLGTRVPTSVEICWTGPRICSPVIRSVDASAIGRVIRRPPMVWDNDPVNDGEMTAELHIGPIRGRDADLDGVVSGILVNPALQPEATLIPLLTWADYLCDPAAYDPDESWRRALLAVCEDETDADAVAIAAAALDSSVIRQPWEQPSGAPLRRAARRIGRLRNRRLADDLAPFVSALAR